MNPERTAFVIQHDLMGWSARQIAARLTAEVEETKEREIQILMESPLYKAERRDALEAFRFHAVQSAADELAMAAKEAAAFLRGIPQNALFKPALKLRAVMDILDRVPQTSKTLRQFVQHQDQKFISDEQLERMMSRQTIDPLALEHDPPYRKNLKELLDVGEKP